jgi:hypothetical protein
MAKKTGKKVTRKHTEELKKMIKKPASKVKKKPVDY